MYEVISPNGKQIDVLMASSIGPARSSFGRTVYPTVLWSVEHTSRPSHAQWKRRRSQSREVLHIGDPRDHA